MFAKKVFSSFVLSVVILLSACSENVSFELAPSKVASLKMSATKKNGVTTTKFMFRESDLKLLNAELNNGCSVEAVIRNLGAKKSSDAGSSKEKFSFGFLTETGEKLDSPTVTGKFSDADSDTVCVSVVTKKLPAGLFVEGSGKIFLDDLHVVPSKVGFDFSSDIPVFAFSSKGGTISKKEIFSSAVDFSDVRFTPDMKFKVKFSPSADSSGRTATVLSVNKEKFYVRKPADSSSAEFSVLAVKNPSGILSLSENKNQISSLILSSSVKSSRPKTIKSGGKTFVMTPIVTDPGLVMWWPKKNWRGDDYEIFSWDRFKGVLIFDIANYDVQDDFFKRIAFFVEKAGYRGQLYSDAFLSDKHGYNAHDYRAESLAEFYEEVRRRNFPLNEKEKLLKLILIENGIIVENGDGSISGGKGAVISISQESQMYLRTQFIAHEGWHGIFFLDADFRNEVYKLFDELDYGTKRYLIRYFQVTPSLNYDVNDEYLLRNEFMAYMLQKPVSEVSKYFVEMASRQHSQEMAKKEADYIISNQARYFVEASGKLDEYVNKRWNLDAGRVWLIN